MKVIDKVIEDFLIENVGKDVIALYQLLNGKAPISEFVLAEKLNLTVNQVRNMLYRMYTFSLVDFTRKKDNKKGWYIYYWEFDNRKGLGVAIEHKEKRLELLRSLLKNEETTQYFSCPDGDVRLNFENAIEHDYKCPECDKVLTQDNNSRKIQRLQKTISEMENEVKEIREIKIERKEEDKPKEKPKKKAVKKEDVKPKKEKVKKPKKAPIKKKVAAKKIPSKKKIVKKVSAKKSSKKKK